MRYKFRYIKLTVLGTTAFLLGSCGNSGSSSATSPVVSSGNSAQTVSIDAMSDIPVINGTPSTGALYLHNYSNVDATNVSFSLNAQTKYSIIKNYLAKAGLTVKAVENQSGFSLVNADLCKVIPAKGSCTINFTTPALNVGDSGNSLVTIDYSLNGVSARTVQVVNYQYTSLTALNGVNFTGNVSVTGKQGSIQYVVGYLYGGGSAGTTYNNVTLSPSAQNVQVSGGFVNNQQVSSGQIIPIELQVAVQTNQPSNVNVTPKWLSTRTTILSGVPLSISLNPLQNAVNFIFGTPPILAAPTTTASVINVINNGNADANGGITATATGSDAAQLQINNSCSSTILLSHAANSCSISFSTISLLSGNATVRFTDSQNNQVGSALVTWVSNNPVPQVSIKPIPSTITFANGTNSGTLVFTVSNIGSAPLSNVTYPITNSSSAATWSLNTGNTCGSTLAPQSQCAISGSLQGVNSDVGVLSLKAIGLFNNTQYSFLGLPINYTVSSSPSLSITPISGVNLTLLANNSDVESQIFTITNNGNSSALFTALSLSQSSTSVAPVISGGSCTSSTNLAPNGSCTVVVIYGPAASSNTANESGSAMLQVNYHGGVPDTQYNVQDSFNYNLIGNDSSVTVGNPTAVNLTGSGTQSDPFLGNASQSSLTISESFVNPSVNYALTNFNLNTNNLPYGLTVDPASTCPTGSAVQNINMGAACSLILDLNPSLLAISPQGGSVVLNYTQPTASWTTPLGFYSESSSSQVYVTYQQPAISFTLSNNSGNFTSTVLSINVANASSGTNPLTANISAVSGWLSNQPTNLSSNCTLNGDTSVSCNFTPTTVSGNVTYTMPNYLQPGESASIPLVFSTNSNAFLSPAYTFIMVESQ